MKPSRWFLAVIGLVYAPTSDWPLVMRGWKALHSLANRAAWRWARPSGPTWGMATRIDHRHPLWRLNDWIAPHWSDWWIKQSQARSEAHRVHP